MTSTLPVESSLVDRLRGDELESLASEVTAGRRDHILKSLDERGRAQELVRQQYSGRYPFELLQNANDAAADAGSQFTSVRFTERLDEIGARPSIGTVADCDNALAETVNGLYKTECVYGPDTNGWDDVDELELATLSWVHWSRPRPGCTATATTYPQQSSKQRSTLPNTPTTKRLESNNQGLHQTQGDSHDPCAWCDDSVSSLVSWHGRRRIGDRLGLANE